MARTMIDLDEEALALAAQELGTTTKVGTVNEALRRIAQAGARREALERMKQRGEAGEFKVLEDRDQLWR